MRILLFLFFVLIVFVLAKKQKKKKDIGQYKIKYVFVSPIQDEIMSVLQESKTIVESMLTTFIPTRVKIPWGGCGCRGVQWTCLNKKIEARDIIIYVRIAPIDGIGNVAAHAGLCRIGQGFSRVALIELDQADVLRIYNFKALRALVLHELLHAIGVGSLWSYHLLINNFQYVGKNALQVYPRVNVENMGGPGSINTHWRESEYGNELMTSRLDFFSNPLSNLTLQSLRDIGHRLNPSFVPDAYIKPTGGERSGLHFDYTEMLINYIT